MSDPRGYFLPGDIVRISGGAGEVLYQIYGKDPDIIEYSVHLRGGDVQTLDEEEMILVRNDELTDDPDDYLGEHGAVQGALAIEVKESSKPRWPLPKFSLGKGKSHPPPAPHCDHWLTPYTLPKGEVLYLSGNSTPTAKHKSDIEPTAGIYLDYYWMAGLNRATVMTNTALRDDCREDAMEVMYVPWKDMGVVTVKALSIAAVWALARLKAGAKLEIGCVGGHGRTGTLLGAILVYQGLTGEEAVEKVRSGYCKKAIETKGQEKLLTELSEALAEAGKKKEN
jgi:hypothetical protein